MSTKPLPLSKAALRMTEIMQAAFDRFTPTERERRIKAYFSGDTAADSPIKNGSRRTQSSLAKHRLR